MRDCIFSFAVWFTLLAQTSLVCVVELEHDFTSACHRHTELKRLSPVCWSTSGVKLQSLEKLFFVNWRRCFFRECGKNRLNNLIENINFLVLVVHKFTYWKCWSDIFLRESKTISSIATCVWGYWFNWESTARVASRLLFSKHLQISLRTDCVFGSSHMQEQYLFK